MIHGMRCALKGFLDDFHSLRLDLRYGEDERWHRLMLGVVFLAVLVNSARFLQRPILYDEAYTFNIFASRPILRIITDYHLPNNHIIHSILVHFSYRLFGNQLWVVRLPAFIAGIFLVPTGYVASKRFFDADTALLSSCLIGFAPILINYSTNGRGYSILCLDTLILIFLGAYVQSHKNKLAWVLLLTFAVIGFYTAPTMLLPFGAFCIWMCMCWLINSTNPVGDLTFLFNLVFLGISTVIIVTLLYTPVFIVSGFEQVVSNSFVASIDKQDYWIVLSQRLHLTWDVFRKGVPDPIVWTLIAGLFLAPLFQKKSNLIRTSFPFVLLIFSASFVLLRRVAPFDRMWLYILPVFLIWASAGLVGLYNFVMRWINPDRFWLSAVVKFGLLILIVAPMYRGGVTMYTKQISNGSSAENVTILLETILIPGDIVVTTFPNDALIRYYFDLYTLNDGETFSDRDGNFKSAFVVVDEAAGQTIQMVLEKEKISLESVDLSSVIVIGEAYPLKVYQLDHH